MAPSMAKTGKVAPQVEKLTIAHNEHTDMDMRSEGMSPKAKTPKAWQAKMESKPSRSMGATPPGWGKSRT